MDKVALFLALALGAAPSVAAEADKVYADYTLKDLVDLANKALRGDSSHGRMRMSIVTPEWERSLEVEGWNRGREMAFIYIHAPAKEKGNITLRRKSEMWLWLPKVERVVKIPPTMMHSAWQGSDFTYEDIVKADSVVKDYEHRLLEKASEADRVVYKIEGIPKPDAPVVWGRIVLWVGVYGKDAIVPLREEDYSERGELVRTISLSDVRELGGRKVPTLMECVPTRKRGQKTTVRYQFLEFDVPLQDEFFSLRRLQGGLR